MSTYQGHLSDGSGIQKHSAGGLYPFVLFVKDTPSGLRYGIIDPDGSEHPATLTPQEAETEALRRKAIRDERMTREAAFRAGKAWAVNFSRVNASAAQKLETLCGDEREELGTLAQQRDAVWSARRDRSLWYDGLILRGLTTDEEINRLQLAQNDAERGKAISAADDRRYKLLRMQAAFA